MQEENKNMTNYSEHERRGKFLISHETDTPMAVAVEVGHAIELKGSEFTFDLIAIDGNLVLGYDLIWQCYERNFLAVYYQEYERNFPMALWDAQTGRFLTALKGLHTGSLRGAKRLDEHRLITWARDFRVFVWSIETGDLLATYSTPILVDDDCFAIVSSRNGENFSAAQWLGYFQGQSHPGFNVTIVLKPDTDNRQIQLGPFSGGVGDGRDIQGYHPNETPINHTNLINRLCDLEHVEAGYSTVLQLPDGRFCIGSTTYGAWEQAFVWDGVRNLTILFPGRMNVCTELRVATDTNTVYIDTEPDTYRFENV